jgi:hypothetical protein
MFDCRTCGNAPWHIGNVDAVAGTSSSDDYQKTHLSCSLLNIGLLEDRRRGLRMQFISRFSGNCDCAAFVWVLKLSMATPLPYERPAILFQQP